MTRTHGGGIQKEYIEEGRGRIKVPGAAKG